MAGLPLIKKSFFLLVVVLLLVTSFGAQPIKAVNASSDLPHPRLYFTSEDLVQLRALRDAPSHQAIWNNIESWADEHIDDLCPAEPSSYGDYWHRADEIRIYIETMGFMYAMTEETKYADAAKEWMFYVVNNWNKWDMYEGYGHANPKMIRGFAFGYDVLHDYLTSSECDTLREKISYNTNKIYEYWQGRDFENVDYPNSLANAACPIGLAALALYDEHLDAPDWLTLAISMGQATLNYGGIDGGWFEGQHYATFAFDLLIPFLDALKRNTGQNLFDNDFLRQVPYYLLYLVPSNPLPLEDTNWDEGFFKDEGHFMYRLASEYNNSYAQWFANNNSSQDMMQAFIWKAPNLTATPPTDLPLTKQFRDIGYVIFKTGWGANDLLFAFKSGTSQGHAHPSQNEFGIYYQGIPITCGPGYVCLEPEDDTWSHNCLLVNGNGQCQEPGDYQSAPLGTRGEILQVDVHDPYYRYALGDASTVYTGWSGTSDGRTYTVGELDKWLRHVVFVEPNYFVIYDEVAASSPKQFDWLLHGYSGSSLSVEGETITLLKNGVKLEVKVLAPEGFVTEKTNYDNCDHLKVRPPASTTQTQFLTVHYPLTTDESMLPTEKVEVGNVIGAKVTNGDKLDLILFSKDGNPVDEYIELGGIYEAIDGGDYLFEDTGVRVQFDSYQVLRLQESVDVTPPVISSVASSNITGASATISWSTNEPATSQVEYGTTEALGLSADLDTSLVTDHSVSLTDLANSTTYYYKVKSKDTTGNLATSKVYNFTTLSPYLSISFIPPTDANNSVVDRNWTEINTSIDGTFGVSSFIDWNRSLVGYWNFNENSGSIANDKSTYGNNGTLINGPQWTTGKFGNALNFDGVDDYVELPDTISGITYAQGTILAWIKAETIPGDSNYNFIYGNHKTDAWGDRIYFGLGNSNQIFLRLGTLADTYHSSISTGSWYHLALTWGNGPSGTYTVYKNGVSVGTGSYSGLGSFGPYSSMGALYRHDTSDYGGSFNGLIDEVRIWNRALSPEEIEASYNTKLYSLSHKFTNLADGTYEYYAYATDLSGNSAETETRTLIIDTILPDISNATLEGHVNFTGRGSNNTKWAESFNVTLFEAGNLSNVLWTGNATTNNIGVFTVSGLIPGTYDIGIKNWTCLSELEVGVALTAGNTTVVDFGTTREGDANNDDWVTLEDRSLLYAGWDTEEVIQGGHYCDLNRDGWLTLGDRSLMYTYWGQGGDLVS